MTTSSGSGPGGILGCVFAIIVLLYGFVQIYAGWLGIAHHLGVGWAVAALVAALVFRFTLPITIGSFFGALNVWDWPLIGAILFALPGLAFMVLMIPGAIAKVFGKIRGND